MQGDSASEPYLRGAAAARVVHAVERVCPGRKPPKTAVKGPASPYKSVTENYLLWKTVRALNRAGRARTVVIVPVRLRLRRGPAHPLHHGDGARRQRAVRGPGVGGQALALPGEGRKPPFLDFNRPARSHKKTHIKPIYYEKL